MRHLSMTSSIATKEYCSSFINTNVVLRLRVCHLVLLLGLATFLLQGRAEEAPSLMTLVGEWRYPDAKMSGATMSDGATLNLEGERTVQSILYKSIFTTGDSISKVADYYKNTLRSAVDSQGNETRLSRIPKTGRSVAFHDDSEGREVGVRVVLVNTEDSSTTLVISRGAMESETHIAWTCYMRL